MDKHKKTALKRAVIVAFLTIFAVIAMINLKDYILRSEAMRAMKQLAEKVRLYKEEEGTVPSKYYVDNIIRDLQGHVRMGKIEYRARWIDIDSGADEILAYSKLKFHSVLFSYGYVVLRLGGQVEWMEQAEFEKVLVSQQSEDEKRVEGTY